MKVTSEQIENRQVKLNIELEKTELDKYMQGAYQRLVNRIAVPGFRKGKAPRDVLENLIGKEVILKEAMEKMLPEVYSQAIAQEKISAIANPQIEVTQMDPVMFKAIVPVQPVVNIGNYQDIRLDYVIPDVEKKDIDTALEQIQYQQSSLIPVERTAEIGDIVTMDISGEEQGQVLRLRKDQVYEITNSNSLPLPGFAEKIVGISKGENRSFTLKYPEDYEMKELAGKEYTFNVTVSEIKKRELPALDDELARLVGSENLTKLIEQVTAQLKARNEQRINLEFENQIFDKLVEISNVEFPPVLSDVEIDGMLEEEAKNFPDGMSGLEKYLNSINKSMDEHKKELYPIAEKRVIRSLILSEIIKLESISVNDSEIDNEIEKMDFQSHNEVNEIKKLFALPQSRKSLENFLLRKKAVGSLIDIAKGKSNS